MDRLHPVQQDFLDTATHGIYTTAGDTTVRFLDNGKIALFFKDGRDLYTLVETNDIPTIKKYQAYLDMIHDNVDGIATQLALPIYELPIRYNSYMEAISQYIESQINRSK